MLWPGLLDADGFGDQVWQAAERGFQLGLTGLAVDAVVVVGEDILVPADVAVIRHRPRTRPRAVEFRGGLPGRGPEPGEVARLVEPGAPDDHRRAASVPRHHVAHVLHHQVLPGRAGAHGVPSRCFFPDQQPELVAGVEEMRRLGIVGAAHHVAVEIVLEYLDVLALHPGGHRHAGVRVELMPVQAEELEPLAVEVEALRPERGLTEPDLPGQDVAARGGEAKRGPDRIELGTVGGPEADLPQIGQAQLRAAGSRRGHPDRRALRGDLRGPVEQLDQQGAVGVRRHRRVDGAFDVHPPLRAEYVGGQGEQVSEERGRDHADVDVPVDPARLKEVDAVRTEPHAHRRDRQAARIDDDRKQVIPGRDLAGKFG